MSAGTQVKEARQQRHANTSIDLIRGESPTGGGTVEWEKSDESRPATAAALLAVSSAHYGSRRGIRNRKVKLLLREKFRLADSRVKFLAKFLSESNLEDTLEEIRRLDISLSHTFASQKQVQVLFLSYLLSSILDNSSAGPTQTSASLSAARRLISSLADSPPEQGLISVLGSALGGTAKKRSKEEGTFPEGAVPIALNLLYILTRGVPTNEFEQKNILPISQCISLYLSLASFNFGASLSASGAIIVGLLDLLERLAPVGQLDAQIPPNLLRTALSALATRLTDNSVETQSRIENLLKKFSAMKGLSGEPLEGSADAAVGLINRLCPPAADAGIGVTSVLANVGPACTASPSVLRETLDKITKNLMVFSNGWGSNGGNAADSRLDETTLARIIWFFSEKGSRKKSKDGSRNFSSEQNNSISPALVGALTSESDPRGHSSDTWDLGAVTEVLGCDFGFLDWDIVARRFDFPEFNVRDEDHLSSLLSLYQSGSKTNFPLAALVFDWRNQAGQLSFLEKTLSVPPSIFSFPVNNAEAADAKTAEVEGGLAACPNPKGWASARVLQRLLILSDVQTLTQRVRDLFVKGLLSCPEVLLCALVRLLHQAGSPDTSISSANANAGLQMKGELMRELIPLFFKPNPHHRVRNAPAALLRLWAISPKTVAAACIEAFRSTASEAPQSRVQTVVHVINIIRLLPSRELAMETILNNDKDFEFSVAVAFVMADHDLIQLAQWLTERVSSANGGKKFIIGLIAYINRTYSNARHRSAGNGSNNTNVSLVTIENIAISLQFLQSQDSVTLNSDVPNSLAAGDSQAMASSGIKIGESVKALIEACLASHPTLSNVIAHPSATLSANSGGNETGVVASSSADDIEEMANTYFQRIYTSEQSLGEVVEMLKGFKTSGNSRENDIFACMIHNLFDEYRFFSKYPEKELRITGILFGMLIQHQLVSSITLGIALRYVLEALRKPPSPAGATTSNSGKMFRFGMFALEQFKERLHEWPQYCSHIVQIPHLKEGYAALVAEIEAAMAENQNRPSGMGSSGSSGDNKTVGPNPPEPSQLESSDTTLAEKPNAAEGLPRTASSYEALHSAGADPPSVVASDDKLTRAPLKSAELTPPVLPAPPAQGEHLSQRSAVFGAGLGRAVTGNVDSAEAQHSAPPDSVLDRVQFLINNVSPSNVEVKAQELKDMLSSQYFGWLGHYLVVKRISTQPNFHSLYLSFLDHLGDYGKGLVEAILSSVYLNVGKLLRSPKITTSTSERSLLKNLGSWLGQITLARNRPILQIMLDCKELLFQGYETGMLIAVTPFAAKILEGAKASPVFRPPNPWLMGLLSVFRALYGVEDLKMNIKFEVEVLCKNLGVKLEEIPLRTEDLAKRISPVKERNPDFNMKSSMMSQPSAPSGSGSRDKNQRAISILPSPDEKQGPAALHPGGSTSDHRTQFPTPATAQKTSSAGSSPGDQQQTLIPNLAAYVNINESLSQLFQQSHGGPLSANLNNTVLKRTVSIAVDRAIREILQPAVERSVTIACITTKEIVTKDYAMESDELKMRKAAQLMVANLAGSLALVTCREPLRASVSTHLRQLLVGSSGGSTSGSSNASSTPQLSEQDQNTLEQCVAICATDNLELGCMLIENAATEKAVQEMNEALAQSFNARKKHREQTGQPFYDMSIFGNGSQRYPAALPEPLRPKPVGLRNDQLLVYEAFQRIPRQPLTNPGSTVVGSVGSGHASISANSAQKGSTQQKINIEGLSSLANQLDSAVSSLLVAAGSRASEITLGMLPPDQEVKQLLGTAQRVARSVSTAVSTGNGRPMNSADADAILGFAQSIFKRLYELSLTEPLRLEVFVALLEALKECCPQLSTDLGTWARFAPCETEGQRKLHRTILLLLMRSRLLAISGLDIFLAGNGESGRNGVWVEFDFLLVRTALMERIATASDFPKIMELFAKIAEGHGSVSQQVAQNYRKPILRFLEDLRNNSAHTEQPPAVGRRNIVIESSTTGAKSDKLTHEQNSSASAVSLNTFAEATKMASEAVELISRGDPAGVKQHVTFLLDHWLRLFNDNPGNEKALQYVQLLHQNGVGKFDDQTERFFRYSTELVVDAVLKNASGGEISSLKEQSPTQGRILNYVVIDAYCKLVSLIIRYVNGGGSSEHLATQRISLLDKVLGIIVRSMMSSYERRKRESGGVIPCWDQRPWFRLLLNLVIDLNSPSPSLDPISLGILREFGGAFHVIQPLVIPGFSFAWLELVSHRMFLSNLLLLKNQKGWEVAHQLLIDLFLFLEPHLRKTELTDAIKHLYKGTLRVLLVLLHDFPSFLAGYHLSFCNVIPENCVQLRNLVLSAFPRGMVLPDPFTPNLKIDLLPEISQSPVILSNVAGPLSAIRGDLDGYLKGRNRGDFLDGLIPRLCKEGTRDVDPARVNSLVLYVGIHAMARLQSSQIGHALSPPPHTPEMEILQKLMDFDDRGRYISLNAIANQLRYPSSHTHYYSCVMLFLFGEAKNEGVKEQVTRVLLERLIVHRPHPWGLLITFIELIKNQRYQFWSHPFTRCATEIEKVFESVARSCMTPASQRSAAAAGGDMPR